MEPALRADEVLEIFRRLRPTSPQRGRMDRPRGFFVATRACLNAGQGTADAITLIGRLRAGTPDWAALVQ